MTAARSRPDERFDVVVVGSGAGGGTVAARLSEDERCSVLLLEAGPDYPQESERAPGFFTGGSCGGGSPPTPDLDWGYVSEPLPGGRRLPLTRGKVAGGSTMTNGCVWVRGRPSDFDRWTAAGADGWGWEDVLPLYERVEREVPAMSYPRELWLPVQRSLADACIELGFRWEDDLNAPGAWDDVVGPWPRNRRNEIRQGSLVTYIRAARARANFTIRDRALVDRVVFDGRRAVGVTYLDAEGRARTVEAGHVVLSAGAFGSAPILLRSGVGPAAALRGLGVDVVADLPVGRRLLDHPYVSFTITTTPAHARTGWPTHAMVARAEGWWGSAEPVDEAAGRSMLVFGLVTYDCPQGTIELVSRDPRAMPRIDLRYQEAIDAGHFERPWEAFQALLQTPTYRSLGARDDHEGVSLADRLPDAVFGGFHAAGGCAIGAVVDPDLRVYGLDGLTVADASVFPSHVSNNPNLTCFAIGEAAAARLASRAGSAG